MSPKSKSAKIATEIDPIAEPKRTKKNTNQTTEAKPNLQPERKRSTRRRVAQINPIASRISNRSGQLLPAVYVIHYLPNFPVDHRADPRAEAFFAGEIPGGSDCTGEIRARFCPKFGSGHFRVSERNSDGTIKSTWVLQVEDLPDAEEIESDFESDDEIDIGSLQPETSVEIARLQRKIARLEGQLSAPQVQPQIGGLNEMLASLKTLDELRAKPEQKPANSAADFLAQIEAIEKARALLSPKTANPAPPAPSQQEQTIERALLTLIAEDPSRLTDVRERLLGSNGEDDESGKWIRVLDRLTPVLADTIPKIGQVILSIVQGRNAPQTPNTAQQWPSQNSPASVPTASQPETDNGAQQVYGDVLGLMFNTMAINGDPEPVAERIDAFLTLYPAHEQSVMSLVNYPAQEVLNYLAQSIPGAAEVCSLPTSQAWFERLQKLFDEEAQGTSQKPNEADTSKNEKD